MTINLKYIRLLFDNIEIDDDAFILYRAISHNGDLKLDKLGVCWSWSEKEAYCYGAKTMVPSYYYVYQAKVKFKDIDWNKTLVRAIEYHPHEKEVVLKEDVEVEVIEVTKRTKTVTDLLAKFNINFKTKT